jgi:hypothetical protein
MSKAELERVVLIKSTWDHGELGDFGKHLLILSRVFGNGAEMLWLAFGSGANRRI